MECNRNGIHSPHHQNQYELPNLFERIEKVEKECDHLINKLKQLMDSLYQQFNSLILGIRNKYQRSKEQFLKFNLSQMNSFFTETILFNSFVSKIDIQMTQASNNFQDSLKNVYEDLKLTQLNYYQISAQDIQKSEELYKKGYKLYWNEKNFKEAINILDQALILNQQHQLALYSKAECLRMLNQYKEAIVQVDKALELNSKHQFSLFCKAECLRGLDQYNEAIIWADKVLEIDPKNQFTLNTKAECLKMLAQYNEAIIWADKALEIDPKHCNSFSTKGNSLRLLKKYKEAMADNVYQDQHQYQEALILYDKALKIIPNNQWVKERKNECLEALKKK
ncbi:unnamed protein product [Paramecium sonneborni]|uniref:Tetratricopeptide repeat protein n=1 Tax=Paramecium sonneborni TaxID=65129 RepID=A0A8S1R8Q7_9CILI|nr:unnamed protein product [Paramecium sonneborni]